MTGSYELCDGTLEGTASGSELTGDWTENPDSCPAQDARGGSEEGFEGTFEFQLSSNDDSFTGSWAYESGGTDPNGDVWEGRRISG